MLVEMRWSAVLRWLGQVGRQLSLGKVYDWLGKVGDGIKDTPWE